MPDLEKVIKCLTMCQRCECDNCTLEDKSGYPWDCTARENMIDYAIALLKEQEEIIHCKDCKFAHITSDGEYCKYCDKEVDDDGFPIEEYYPSDWYCPLGERK